MTARTPPPPDTPFGMSDPAPPGYRWELRPDPDWRLASGPEHAWKCRRRGCPNTPAAALRRGRKRSAGAWWLYCSDHMYGRVIIDGVVMLRHSVPLEKPPHPRGPEAILADLRELAARPDDGPPMRFPPADARAILRLLETRKETP